MLTMRDHGVQDYAVLPDMDGTDVGVLNDDDRACLAEVGQYLATTDAWNRFGIWLLHKHFEPSDGEVFVEQLAHSPRGTRTAPIERTADLTATAIRFDDSVDAGVGAIGSSGLTGLLAGCRSGGLLRRRRGRSRGRGRSRRRGRSRGRSGGLRLRDGLRGRRLGSRRRRS